MQPNGNRVDGPVEIMIVSYATPSLRVSGKVVSDLDWLVYAVRSIRKFCTGFQGLTIVHPNHERALFEAALAPYDIFLPVRFHGFDEIPGKGFIQHEIMLARAEQCVPEGTRYVLLTDSDYLFRIPTTPEDYFANDRPYYLIRPWHNLVYEDPNNPNSKAVSDCAQWKPSADAQVGFDTQYFTMAMNCAAFPLEFFPAYRTHIESIHRQPFDEWMLAGKNSFPQDRHDWCAMGSVAQKYMHDLFTWIDVSKGVYPADRRRAFWSHGSITDEARAQMEEILK